MSRHGWASPPKAVRHLLDSPARPCRLARDVDRILRRLLVLLAVSSLAACSALAGSVIARPISSPRSATTGHAVVTTPAGTPLAPLELSGSTLARYTQTCSLLDSRDLASFFSSAEVVLPRPEFSEVTHPRFAVIDAAGQELTCAYYTFHRPGSSARIMLQVTYWVDTTDNARSSQAWQAAWGKADLTPAEPLTGLGPGAFWQRGQMSFKYQQLYITIAATETDWNLSNVVDMQAQRSIEKQVALDMLARLQ